MSVAGNAVVLVNEVERILEGNWPRINRVDPHSN